MDNLEIWDKKWSSLAEYATFSAGNRWAFGLIKKLVKNIDISSGIIADMGCGIGNKTAVLAKAFPKCTVIGYDFSAEGIEFAEKYYDGIDNLSFECADAREALKDKKQNIELISAFELIEHLEDWKSFCHDMCVLSNRYVLLSTPCGRMREYEKDLGHYRNFKKNEIETFMMAEGYRKVDVLYAGFPFWSPLTRDFYNVMSKKKKNKGDEMVESFNKTFHNVTYFLYRYLTFSRLGDQFLGLFEKNAIYNKAEV